MNEALDFLALLSIRKLTESKLYLLLEEFHTPTSIRHASREDLVPIVGQELAQKITSLEIDDRIRNQHVILQKLNSSIVPYYSPDYPQWLKRIDHFPPVLFVRGTIIPEDEISIAIIGTRGATVYGKNIAENFAAEFARAGVTVVSGMARGIDTTAHQGALQKNGRTIAVLGSGIDICYPPENKQLMENITQHGAIITEFTIGTPPLAQNFPKRNRIISGLAKAIVAIEAKEKSGVMNTVRWALEQNKDVFAIPGNIYAKTSCGTNRLIKEGAIPVTSAGEILELSSIQHTRVEREARELILTDEEKAIWAHLSHEPTYVDTLAEKLNRPTGPILNTLLNLEIKGLVKQLPGMLFVKNFQNSM
jgi:DNA processing protein